MPSSLAWLDNSREDQQRMRELLSMFSDSESRDELGIGQIRDAFADLLFPGTSTLHTRAKYFLLVPWCYLTAEKRGVSGARFSAAVDQYEKLVIRTLKDEGDTDGLIGRRAGPMVKSLPSSVYWSALGRYRIRLAEDRFSPFSADGEEELTERQQGMWHATLPKVPVNFPHSIPGGLDLLPGEAMWLRERILSGAGGTLLAHLVLPGQAPGASDAPWLDAAAMSVTGRAKADLEHAELFSLAIQGARLLYNLLIAEVYVQRGFSSVEDPVGDYRARLAEWAEQMQAERRFGRWDRDDMWAAITGVNPRIASNQGARAFVNRWLDQAVSAPQSIPESDAARRLVRARESAMKKKQSRLTNEALLRAWSGASGSRPLVFRWPQVKRLLTDIHEGVADATA